MKPTLKQCLTFLVPVLFYESFQEGDKDAGREGAMLDEANANLYLRGGTADDCREAVAEFVEEKTAVPRKVRAIEVDEKGPDGKPTGKKVPVLNADKTPQTEFAETEGDYVARALAEKKLTGEALQKDFDAWLAARKDAEGKPYPPIRISSKAAVRKPAQPKKLAQEYLTHATAALANPKTLTGFSKVFKSEMGRDLKPDATTAEALGWEIKALMDERARKAKEQTTKLFASA